MTIQQRATSKNLKLWHCQWVRSADSIHGWPWISWKSWYKCTAKQNLKHEWFQKPAAIGSANFFLWFTYDLNRIPPWHSKSHITWHFTPCGKAIWKPDLHWAHLTILWLWVQVFKLRLRQGEKKVIPWPCQCTSRVPKCLCVWLFTEQNGQRSALFMRGNQSGKWALPTIQFWGHPIFRPRIWNPRRISARQTHRLQRPYEPRQPALSASKLR